MAQIDYAIQRIQKGTGNHVGNWANGKILELAQNANGINKFRMTYPGRTWTLEQEQMENPATEEVTAVAAVLATATIPEIPAITAVLVMCLTLS